MIGDLVYKGSTAPENPWSKLVNRHLKNIILPRDDDLDWHVVNPSEVGFPSLPRTIRLRIYYFILWNDFRQTDNADTKCSVDKFLDAVKLVSPIRHELRAEAMITRILGVTYDAAWRQESSEQIHPTSLLMGKRLADPTLQARD